MVTSSAELCELGPLQGSIVQENASPRQVVVETSAPRLIQVVSKIIIEVLVKLESEMKRLGTS